ncbi:hypothetical protein [Candidatus Pseudothioglobus sp. Uisw_050_01]|uniref:hypothetical protein n=1 Tax=Candidatus Pseudothioglobus sp. Uisw_050_01 TaxID=3230997 RepID=UPI003A8935C2
MKKLIALFAVSTIASTSAIAAVEMGGSASVSYDDNGSAGGAVNMDGASTTTYDADITLTGTTGSTTVNLGWDVDGTNPTLNIGSMTTTIGPLSVAVDFYNEDNSDAVDDIARTGMPNGNDDGGVIADATVDRSITVSLDAPIGDATIGLDDSGDVTVSGTWSGVTLAHTVKDGADKTVGSASIAGMDVSLTNDGGSSTWSIGTTVAGAAITLNSDKSISAAFGVTGNIVTVSHTAERAAATATANAGSGASAATIANTNATDIRDAFTTIAISRDLTSGAALAATYDTLDSSLTLKASVAF